MFENPAAITIDEKIILREFVNTIPTSIFGPDRVRYIADNADKLAEGDKLALRNFVNKALTRMIESEASDIEIGGRGNEGYIWMRIHGNKERVRDIPQFTEDESALIIVNLFNENQRQHLLTKRNLDFSYTYFYEKRKINVRFRADAYFDLDTLAMNMRLINLSVRPLSSLEFHPLAVRSVSHNYIKFGLTLITGITGSGN